jgi:histidyl-tRNA synthetase
VAKTIQSVKGMRDLLPPETAVWAAVEERARRVFASYGYGEIRTPILEETELFVRGVGESSDIVGKEMYSFVDRGGRSLTLRPESTAAVARAFVEHRLADKGLPAKLFYIGPQFRYERPQAGRYRQFFQIGAELLGDPGPLSDAEVLLMLVALLRELGFHQLTVLVNTVGDTASRAAYREALVAFLRPLADQLSEDSRRRLETNPLRILDTKSPTERELLKGAPRLADSLSGESREHFAAVLAMLDRFGVRYRVEERLVRGLDYYTRTVFEIVAEGLGAQDAICGGGRYDGLVAELGGPELPGIGFAIGEDRLLSVLPASFRAQVAPRPPALVAALGQVPAAEALALAEELRQAGVAVVADLAGRSLKAVFKQAERLGAERLVLLGDDEVAAGTVTVKNLTTGQQQQVARAALAAALAANEGAEA